MTAPLARVVHSVPGRARLRVPGAKGDARTLEALQTALEDAPSVSDVRVNPLTGSLLVVHDGPIGDILRQVEQRGGLRVDAGTPEPWLASMHRSLIESDERLKAASSSAPKARSSARWSGESVTVMTLAITICLFFRSPRSWPAPTASVP